MSGRFGPLEVRCDAPPYAIVRGCRMAGLSDPEDVAWYRLSRPAPSRPPSWRSFLGGGAEPARKCVCGAGLPELAKYQFTLASGREASYLIGQCAQCGTIFWEELARAGAG